MYKTKQKERIMYIIKNKSGLFTIKDIYNELNKSIGLTTIYRFVDKLICDDIVQKEIGNDNITYYRYLKSCNNKNHFYLKCDNCKRLIHIDCKCINELSNHIEKEHLFNLNNKHIIINGFCNKCSKGV